MVYTKKLKELSKKDAHIAGGKGASLGEMINSGIPVPDGYVVTAETFDHFLSETDLVQEIQSILDTVNVKAIHTSEDASEKIQGLIKSVKMPEDIKSEILSQFKELNSDFVAVRSSATAEDGAEHAWAGQLNSYLNTREENLLEMVQNCWASLFTPRAIFYRFEKDLHTTHISVAVVVQKMVNSEKSGIAFSVHPVTEDHNQLIIEAGLGLGEAIVSGSVTPDSYVVTKEPKEIIDINVNTQNKALYRGTEKTEHGFNEWKDLSESQANEQVLNKDQILELSTIIETIENHYGFPCDIEWAFEGGKFYIVQSRPITTLTPKDEGGSLSIPKRSDYILSFWAQGVTPLVTDLSKDMFSDFDALLMIDNGTYKQFFLNKKYKENLDKGVDFFGHKTKFVDYIESMEKIWTGLEILFKENIYNQDYVSKDVLENFLVQAVSFVNGYAQMNVEHTDKAFLMINENSIIKDNLDKLSVFKDKMREKINSLLFLEDSYLNQVVQKLSKQFNLETGLINSLSKKELLGIFDGSTYGEYVLNRNNFYIVGSKDEFNLEGEEAKSIVESFRDQIKNESTIFGQTANKGKIVGKVKIIPVDYSNFAKISEEIDKMNQGDILVAETTAPELIMACKKAGAIVTDMGGLMSHAAIISRELNIPCIVGTKNASKMLKDGDEVEVDADNGVVRILKSKKDTENFIPKDYIRMFAGKAFSYILTNLFLTHYGTLGVLSLQDEESWMSFLPKSTHIKTLEEGQKLYTSEELFNNFHREFNEYMNSTSSFCESVLKKEEVTTNDVKEFFDRACKHWVFYSKTEFFYTDNIDLEKMVINIEEFDKLKLDGRAYLNKLIFEDTGYVKGLLDKISSQTSVSRSELLNYKVEEIINLLDKQEKVPVDTLEKREVFFASQDRILFGDDSRKIVGEFLKPYRELSNIIKGTVARKGKVIAKARVLMPEFKDFDKILKAVELMEQGEVLVAETTSPDIISACKKASAIITNQGGTLSHAAIISRELGIPCIIGTDKDVILNIKTGDLLEVDADNGVIKILK